MLCRTHLVGALVIGLIFLQYKPQPRLMVFFAALFLSALLPDIDAPKSAIGEKIPVLSWLLRLLVGHRTLFHAIWLPAILFFAFSNKSISMGIIIGYCSHLLLDSLNKEGVQPLYPLKLRFRGFMETGGPTEHILFLSLLISAAILAVGMHL
jgi:inner membrane protein